MHETAAPQPATTRPFPADDIGQTAEIMAVLATAPTPLTKQDILLRFKPAKNLRPKIESVLAGLTRLGLITTQANQISLRRTS